MQLVTDIYSDDCMAELRMRQKQLDFGVSGTIKHGLILISSLIPLSAGAALFEVVRAIFSRRPIHRVVLNGKLVISVGQIRW